MKTRFRVAAVAAVSAAAIATPALAVHAWSSYHWKKISTEISPPIGDNVDSKWDSYLDMAIVDWNKSSVINSAEAAGRSNPKNCKAVSGTIQVCNSRYGQTGWLGVAQIWLSGGHIVQGITKLNDTYFDTARYNTPAWRAMVTCQEIGHDYGLGHQDEDFNNPDFKDVNGVESCMDYTSVPEGNEHPNKHDYDQLDAIYNHTESNFTAVGPGKSSAGTGLNGAVGGDTPGEWGRAVHFDAQGRPDYFMMDLGGGKRKLTHVFWTLEAKRGGSH